MAGPRSLVVKKINCPNRDCKRAFSIERYGVQNKVVKDKCPFCSTEVKVKFD